MTMASAVSVGRLWDEGRSRGVVPAGIRPSRTVLRWVDEGLWRAVSVSKVSGDQVEWHVWVGVADFLDSLGGLGRMGVDVQCDGDYRPWPRNKAEASALWLDPIQRALECVQTPLDVLDALEAGAVERAGCVVGRRIASRPATLVPALVLAEHLGEPGRARSIREAIRDLKGTPLPLTGQDGYASARSWAMDFGKALGRPVEL